MRSVCAIDCLSSIPAAVLASRLECLGYFVLGVCGTASDRCIFSWTVGLFQDVLEGSTLGMNAFAYAVMAYLLVSMYQRFKLFPLIQQSFMVFMLIGIDLMICHLVKSVTGVSASGFVYLYPAITSAAIWPFFYLMMSNLTRKLG